MRRLKSSHSSKNKLMFILTFIGLEGLGGLFFCLEKFTTKKKYN